jgi:hypothetical protein
LPEGTHRRFNHNGGRRCGERGQGPRDLFPSSVTRIAGSHRGGQTIVARALTSSDNALAGYTPFLVSALSIAQSLNVVALGPVFHRSSIAAKVSAKKRRRNIPNRITTSSSSLPSRPFIVISRRGWAVASVADRAAVQPTATATAGVDRHFSEVVGDVCSARAPTFSVAAACVWPRSLLTNWSDQLREIRWLANTTSSQGTRYDL